FLLLILIPDIVECVSVDDNNECFGTGSIVGAVFGTLIVVFILLGVAYFFWNYYWRSRKGKHLVLETDVENVGDQFAFDNPCFKDGTIPAEKLSNKVDLSKTKWTHWSPLGALSSHKHDKRKTLDDSLVEAKRINLITLRSHDFTGLGFNVQGNMRDGIFIKDVLHRGPAFESGKVNSGDRIVSVRISFDHMVYEDALTILSYASPYEVQLELESSTRTLPKGTPNGTSYSAVIHPVYKSGSSGDLTKIGKSAQQRLFKSDDTEYPTLKLGSQPTTLERPKSVPSPIIQNSTNNTLTKPERTKKAKTYSPSQLKQQLEQNFQQNDKKLNENLQQKMNDQIITNNIETTIVARTDDPTTVTITNEIENTKNKLQKYGVRVLPQQQNVEATQTERSQNENNINYEKYNDEKISDVEIMNEMNDNNSNEQEFNRQNSLTSSGIKRDKAGIPQEIPDHMLQAANAANAARKNRKSVVPENENIENISNGIDTTDSSIKLNKKSKGKAPAPPPVTTTPVKDEEEETTNEPETIIVEKPIIFKETIQKSKSTGTIEAAIKSTVTDDLTMSDHIVSGNCNFEYSSDSDADTDQNSVINNTIELNASDITIHHSSGNSESEGTDISNDSRKAASLGDLSKYDSTGRRTGTLERAQSLDITDTGSIPTLTKKRKAPNRPEDEMIDLDNFNSDEFLYSNSLMKNKEPRLSLGNEHHLIAPPFQMTRLKKWGNLEDVIANIPSLESESNNLNENKSDFDKEKNLNTIVTTTTTIEEKIDSSPTIVTNNLPPETIDIKTEENIVEVNDKPEFLSDIPIDSAYNSEPYSSLTFSIGETTIDTPNNDIIENNVQTLKITTENKDIENEANNPTTVTFTPFSVEKETLESCLKNTSESLNEKFIENPTLSEKLSLNFTSKLYDTNVSDDIKVSRHSLGSLERPKSDVLKNVNKLKQLQSLIQSDLGGVSNVTITTEATLPTNDNFITENGNITHFQINTNDDTDATSTELYTTAIDTSLEPIESNIDDAKLELMLNKNGVDEDSNLDNSSDKYPSLTSSSNSFVTEIEVSPNKNNISEVTINNNGVQENEETERSPKKLPEMKFTTSSYENSRPAIETKRLSQIEMLRSNFENKTVIKSPTSPTKSKIPVAIHTKTTSPDRPASYNVKADLDSGDEKEIIDIMSKNTVHSTPLSIQKLKNPVVKNLNNKNVTVTSIRTSSKIPSGHFTAGNFPSRPPIPPRRNDNENTTESTFQQWVFTPTDTKYTSSANVTEKKSE
ncbi:probable serine/threonine-protein kinase DDB_G0282963, partial [Chrysoperla carnea]|uniref:probable serine/threonine-protein kinase DDB_G0282963 n=1 Tax=Chrysoperla carnea TaxID=189513 RepID=UPI001D08E89C